MKAMRPIGTLTIALGFLLLIFARTWAGPLLTLVFVFAAIWWPFQGLERSDRHPVVPDVHAPGPWAPTDSSGRRGGSSPITSSRPTHPAL